MSPTHRPSPVRGSLLLFLIGALLGGCANVPTTATPVPPESGGSPAERDRILDLDCGGQRAELRFEGGEVTLAFDQQAARVVAQPTASGQRWASTAFDDTWIWNKGEEYTISFRGQPLPRCTANERRPKPLVAVFHEPGFHLSILDGTMTVQRPGQEPVKVAVGEPSAHEGDRVWRGSLEDRGLVLRIGGARCRDAASGLWHPATALLTVGGDTHPGCAGDPADLLAVGEWQVLAIDGDTIPEEPPVTIEFLAAGRVAGSGGCNRYGGSFAIGEGLTLGSDLMSTMMACTDAVMATERRLLDALAGIRGFDFDEDGRLLLTRADQPAIVARRR